jgi:hypothetical protein
MKDDATYVYAYILFHWGKIYKPLGFVNFVVFSLRVF